MSLLIVDGIRYKLYTIKYEKEELHRFVKKYYKEIFGKNSIYFEAKTSLKSSSGIIHSIPDGYVIDPSKRKLYVVENELASHPVYEHIVTQLTKFINGIENQMTKNQLIDFLYEKINKDSVLKAQIQKVIGQTDIHHFISQLLSQPPEIVVIVDKKTSDIEEACKTLRYQPIIIEFKSYSREDAEKVYAHVFDQLESDEKPSKDDKKWQEKLSWVNADIRELTEILRSNILQLGDVEHKASGPHYVFYKNRVGSKTTFIGLILSKKALKVRIRVDSTTFNDPKNWTKNKEYKKWFFKYGKGQEREFIITTKDQLPYAMELIKHSYEITE